MRKSLFLVLALAACATEQTVPLAVLSEHPAQGAARMLPVVPIRWESQPDLPAKASAGGVPVSLTASDGTGLEIRALDATAVIEDPLAFTEIRFVFRNPAPRPVEGRFEITLPPNAAISRFAMRQSWGWQEGEVVELQAARAAYEDFLHRRSDPALLEKQAGNRFQARVFPIPASGEKEIVFSYSQELTRAEDPYRLYLRGLPRIGAFDLRVLYDRNDDPASPGRKSYELHETGFTPERDFRLALPAASPVAHGLRRERLNVARITPIAEAAPDPVASLLVLFDTSASRSLGFRAEVDRLGDIVDALKRTPGRTVPLVVACFDQDVAVVHDGTAGEFGRRELDAVLARKALGASDLGKALHFASTFTPRSGVRPSRVLVVSDGVVTAGEQDAADLDPLMKDLRKAGVERLDAVIDGGIHDEALAKQLAVGRLPRDGVVLDIELGPTAIAERLGRRAVSGIKVEVPGSAWVWPRVLNGVQPGDQVVVYASIPEDRPFEVALQGPVSSRQTIQTGAVERPLIERAMASAEIQRLSAERSAAPDEETREGLRQRIIALSTKHRVLSDHTGLLVLETDQDYARFKIDRQALADILTVGPTGVELLDRNKPKVAAAEVAEAAPPSPDTIAFNKTKAPARNNLVAPSPPAQAPPPAAAAAPPSSPVMPEPPAPPPLPNARPAPSPPAETARLRALEPAAPGAPPSSAPPREERDLGGTRRAESLPPPPPPPPPAPQRVVVSASNEIVIARAAASSRPAAGRAPSARWSSPGDPMGGPVAAAPPRQTADEVAHELLARSAPPYQGLFRDVMDLLAKKQPKEALDVALRWHEAEPGDVLALTSLGEAYEALGQKGWAARAYGSIIDLFPSRADLRRFAGGRLMRLGTGPDGALDIVIDTYRHAAVDRPDHPASHHFLAFALLRAGRPEEAFEAILAGHLREYPPGRFRGADRILREDVGLVAAAWIRLEPSKKAMILDRVARAGASVPTAPSLRFVLTWETDSNDVDFHIVDAAGGHAFYQNRALPSGGELYADITTGYGPECFTIEGRPRAYPYRLAAHYFSRGPMGYGMGTLEIIEHDGRGGLRFDERPYVVMADHAFVDLGTVKGPLPVAR